MSNTFHLFFWLGMALGGLAVVFIILAQTRDRTGADFPFLSRDPSLIAPEGRMWRLAGYLAILGFLICVALAFSA